MFGDIHFVRCFLNCLSVLLYFRWTHTHIYINIDLHKRKFLEKIFQLIFLDYSQNNIKVIPYLITCVDILFSFKLPCPYIIRILK